MNTTTRIERLAQLRAELQSLLSRTERRTYGDPIENLTDLIADLQLEQGECTTATHARHASWVGE